MRGRPACVCHLSVALFFWLGFLVAYPQNQAAGGKGFSASRGSGQLLQLKASLALAYDDNIINYSDADLDLYAGNVRPDKFAIESRDDWILTPQVETRLKGRFLGSHTAWLAFRFRHGIYANNNIRKYSKYSIEGRHYLKRGAYVHLAYYYVPKYYYRNEFHNGSYLEAFFSKRYLKAEVGSSISSSLKSDISYRYKHKSFNAEFRERDIDSHRFRLDLIWNVSRKIKLWGFYGLETASARGADDPDPNVKDVSYDAWDITLGARHYAGRLSRLKPQFVASFEYREIRFQTAKYQDAFRFGRKDINYEAHLGTAWSLFYGLMAEIDYFHRQKSASLPDQALENRLNYKSNTYSLKLSRKF